MAPCGSGNGRGEAVFVCQGKAIDRILQYNWIIPVEDGVIKFDGTNILGIICRLLSRRMPRHSLAPPTYCVPDLWFIGSLYAGTEWYHVGRPRVLETIQANSNQQNAGAGGERSRCAYVGILDQYLPILGREEDEGCVHVSRSDSPTTLCPTTP